MTMSVQMSVAGQGAVLSDLRWLVRYANHCGFFSGNDQAILLALKRAFGAAAWRILCRSPKERFIPILRNRDLSLRSLITYCQRLAAHSFVQAPQAILLEYFVNQRRLYLTRPCRVPEDEDYVFMRVADRHNGPKMRDIAWVNNWTKQARVMVRPQHKWTSLVRRAEEFREHQQQQQLAVQRGTFWYFYCGAMDWRGYRVEPITNSAELWLEGVAMGNCLYKLRHECNSEHQNRFFSIKKDGKRFATLELVWSPPVEEFHGMDRELGQWRLQDLRLSFNRLPGKDLLEGMHGFAWMFNFWAKRPGRMPSGHAQETRQRIAQLNGWTAFTNWPGSFACAG